MELLHRVVRHEEQERRVRASLDRHATDALKLLLGEAFKADMLRVVAFVRLLDLLVGKQDRQYQDDEVLDPGFWLPVELVWGDQVEISVNLVIITVLVRTLERLESRVHGVKDNRMFFYQVFYHLVQRVFADRRIEHDLEVL